MRQARDEVTTPMVDLTRMSLAELHRSDDPMLLRSLLLVADRTERSRTCVFQNQAPNER